MEKICLIYIKESLNTLFLFYKKIIFFLEKFGGYYFLLYLCTRFYGKQFIC